MAKSQLTHTGLGAQSYERNFNDWVKGMNVSDDSNIDAGFSPRTTQINPTVSVGCLSAPAPYTVVSSTLTAPICASCDDGLGLTQRVFLTALSGIYNAHIYTLSGGVLTDQSSVNASTKHFSAPYSDLVYWGVTGKYYATQSTDNDITEWTVGTPWTVVDNWFSNASHFNTTLIPGAVRPMIVFNNNLYIADRYQLDAAIASVGGASVSAYNVGQLVLSAEWNITALAIDPSSGLMLVAHSTSVDNPNGSVSVRSRVGFYDGTNPTQFRKVVEVDDIITAFKVVGSVVYCTMLNKLGIFNGNGVQVVRNLNFDTTLGNLPFKQLISNNKNTLLVADTLSPTQQYGKLLAYGMIAPSYPNAAYYVSNGGGGAGAYPLSIVAGIGNNKVAYSYYDGTNGHLEIVDLGSTSVGTATFYDNSTYFPRPVIIRAVDVYLKGTLTTGSHTITFIDDNNNTVTVGTFDSSWGSARARFIVDSQKTSAAQLVDTMASPDQPLKRLVVWYDFIE